MRYWCTLYLTFFFGIIHAQDKLCYVYADKDSAFNSQIQNSVFKPLNTFNFGLKNGYYWVKIEQLPNLQDNVISIEGHHISSVTGYTSTKALLPPLKNVRYPSLYINPQASFPLYIKIKVEHEAYFPIHFYSRSGLESQQQRTLFSYGIFYGALLFICVIMIILFIVTGEDNFWTYAILLLSIGIALAFRDNVPYLFGWKDSFYYNLELATHILIGIFGGYFAYSFIDLGNKKAIGKILIFICAGLAMLSMFCYWFFRYFNFYALADALIFLSIVTLWIVSFNIMKKSTQLYWVFGIFAINIYFIFDFLILYNFGYTLLDLSPATIKIGLLVEMLIICFTLLNDWHSSKQKTLVLGIELQKRSEEVKLLSQYKRQDDIKDTYLENLIKNNDLSNIEVKILQMLSAGFTETQIAQKHRISTAVLKTTINSLYVKIGIDKNDEIDKI